MHLSPLAEFVFITDNREEMDSQLFLYVNLMIGVVFFLWFMSARKPKDKTVPLDLKKGGFSPLLETQKPQDIVPSKPPQAPVVPQARQLNILFLYNGHDWDAHQVLGVPAGTSLSVVTQRYQQLIKSSDAGQIQFYEAAYRAILKGS